MIEKNYDDLPRLLVKGYVKIIDKDTGEVLVEDSNDIHPENMSFAIAQSLSSTVGSGAITEMRFGNGGTTVIAAQDLISYKRPNVSGLSSLYNETYQKVINGPDVDSNFNSVRAIHIPGQIFSDIVSTCTLGLNEPSDANNNDRTQLGGISTKDLYLFDELGLYDSNGTHLTHIIFHPVEKAKNRVLQVIYTIRIQLV